MGKAAKFYAVAAGRTTGVYTSWAEAEPLVKGFRGARYKSFATRAEAAVFCAGPPMLAHEAWGR